MTQSTTTTPLDDPATVTAIITEAAARSAGGALGGPTGAHRLIVQLCADAVAPVVQQLVRDRDEALAERDAAKLTVAHVEQRCAEYAIALHETLGEGDEARIRAEAAEAELAACRPSGIRIVGGPASPRCTCGDTPNVIVNPLCRIHARPILSAVEPEPRVWSLPEPQAIAQRFHETYERLAPDFGYRTREASAKPWADVPEGNRALMVATAAEVRVWLTDATAEVTP